MVAATMIRPDCCKIRRRSARNATTLLTVSSKAAENLASQHDKRMIYPIVK
jgi:hypothetical protein